MADDLQTKKWTKAKIRKILGPTLIVAGMLYTVRSHFNACPHEVILAGWAIAPPIWLFIEYQLFDREKESPQEFEHFKYGQQLVRNVWIGMVIFLAALYLGKWD